ncbi:hypothetical protein ACOSP7_013171 [Xanthoceras sorbifolium]
MGFSKVAFWVQLFNVPLMCMNRRTAKMLAGMIGEVVDVPIESKNCWGKFIRVKVEIDVSKPLKKGLRVWLEEFDIIITVPIKYERLPDFCYGCGLMGHSVRECMDKEARRFVMESAFPKFGSWLRASPLSTLRNSKQKSEGDEGLKDGETK